MRLKGLMRPMGLMRLMGLVGLVGLVGCSSEDDEVVKSDGPVLEVTAYMAGLEEKTLTRAWAIPTGFTAYEDGVQPIGIALTKVGETTPKYGSLFKGGDKWRTSFEEIEQGEYYLYGYIPYIAEHTLQVSSTDYSAGATVTLQGVPTVMPHDLCVVIGAKHGTDAEHVSELHMGDFGFTATAINKASGTTGGNYVFLLLDHLYSSLQMKIRVHPDYAELRTIRLKSLKLRTLDKNGAPLKKEQNITIELTANNNGENPIQDITYTPTGDDIAAGGITFWSSGSGTDLPTSYQTFNGYFMPIGSAILALTSVYDVYDRKGNLIRKDCTATNTKALKDILTGQTEAHRGYRYIINLTVQPTYLYQLSEPDVDNPEIVIN